MTTQVALVGGNGRLGKIIHSVIDALDGFTVRNVLDSSSALDEMDGADLVVDASSPAGSVEIVRGAVQRGINTLVGTSGWTQQRIAQLRPLVEEHDAGVVFVPNFSLGSALGSALAAAAAPFFPSAEIIEAHGDHKIDSPSGTAVRTAELMAQAREERGPFQAPHVDQRARGQQVASVPVHSLRRPGVIAKQEVILSGAGESLMIVHDTVDSAKAYAPGIRVALPYARDAKGIVIGLENMIDLGIGRRA